MRVDGKQEVYLERPIYEMDVLLGVSPSILPSATVVRHNALPIFIMAYCIDLTRSNFIAESSFYFNKLYPIYQRDMTA